MRTTEINTKDERKEQFIRRIGRNFSAKDRRKEAVPFSPEQHLQKNKKGKRKMCNGRSKVKITLTN